MSSERSSTYKSYVDSKLSRARLEQTPQLPTQRAYTPPTPSIRLLFSRISRQDLLVIVLPAVLSSLVAGGVAPFMTVVVGSVFDAFANFPLSNASDAERHTLLKGVGFAAIELAALAVGAIALGSITSALWISAGERNVMRIRSQVYAAVSSRDMEWFDMKMGAEDPSAASGVNGTIGAGGLMAKFNRDTDDVRMASSLTSGLLLQYLTTCVTCLILAFIRSWALTLVILSAVPALMIIQIVSQRFSGPLIGVEREQTAVAATFIERAVAAISTVKAFNAQSAEQASLSPVLVAIGSVTVRINAVFGMTSAFSQFASMAMFVQGFWFGAHLVRNGSASAGDVMAVFWACLIAASNLQMCIPQFVTLARGKFAMVALVSLIDPPPQQPEQDMPRNSMASASSPSSLMPKCRTTSIQTLRKIQPARCMGEFSLHEVTFAYPSRSSVPVLRDVSLYFPASETTFVVGGSGSGKSTIAQLLARLYTPAFGVIALDDQDVSYIDEQWLRSHVAVVSQSCILFDGSVHDNVAMGVAGLRRQPKDVTRDEVVAVCTAALMHEFVRDLPDGYDTRLGNGGANLSGGQKQRLAIARAMLRDPTVLVLDEATSALDATSRVLVFEAIKECRKNKTTIVITHDLSQITPGDFVYVLKDGGVVEQGYRSDLEEPLPDGSDGAFRAMMRSQGAQGGFVPKRESQIADADPTGAAIPEDVERILERSDAEKQEEDESDNRRLTMLGLPPQRKAHQSVGISAWMLDVVSDLSRQRTVREKQPTVAPPSYKATTTLHKHQSLGPTSVVKLTKRQSSAPLKKTEPASGNIRRHFSLQFTPSSPGANFQRSVHDIFESHRHEEEEFDDEDEIEQELEKTALERMAAEALRQRQRRAAVKRIQWTEVKLDNVVVDAPTSRDDAPRESTSFFALIRDVYPTVPNKPVILIGLVICVLSGALTPIFSFLLSRLLFQVSIGAENVRTINVLGGIVLAVAACDGLLIGLKFFVMESGAMTWITRIRKACYARLLAQDKSFFDRSDNNAPQIVQRLMKDGDDARNLISVVLAQCLAVSAMLGVGLVWALVQGWQLTLAGFAIAPVFAVAMSVQANLVARAERRNKTAREEIARAYYECISNIRAIRCMSFENVFQNQFEESIMRAYRTGIRGAFVEGCSFGVANGLIYFAEALLFFIGAVLVANGTYSYLQMVEVLNLVVFTVTIGAQLMGFTQKIARATQATRDLNKILFLSTDTEESRGSAMPPIQGDIKFNDVDFSYPERSDVPVLQSTSLRFKQNECIAVVGASGSGKSTIAALLQRLYEPNSGSITIGGNSLHAMDVKHLRAHIAVVSQSPNLFDASIAENIAYGNAGLSPADVCYAAQAARVHDFIMSLPQGYETHVGENASLISGGQAQRLAIARALARPARVLILDECTSALDPESQAAVMETIRSVKVGRTTLVVTHKLPVMRLCDRIVVIDAGSVAEEGTYDELIASNGMFAQLARGGEWMGE
ncbi:P-loop containing nucleoside triphosphate hydrolase protein [Fomitiporia mediterranea MF3/22]|uniref:P-loop containing nucleoside triphosphate hydrolase protein n=1 Tax=Fomitiporia mediterranea (strain MF3/22) TaxID=694068 RepID=UPI0004407D32|nr:P-loop containing nucleoside triphosphate hydrolase protein [Fomitiporia mediterranea MF3/22]EJD01884.1 P-loop containing nucleoside triphosphate hydrolase protein [Fomitiporia mediterranea MF3/22]